MDILIDRWGRDSLNVFYGREAMPCDIDSTTTDGVTYLRFYRTTPCAVWKVSDTGVEIAWIDWADRASSTDYLPDTSYPRPVTVNE